MRHQHYFGKGSDTQVVLLYSQDNSKTLVHTLLCLYQQMNTLVNTLPEEEEEEEEEIGLLNRRRYYASSMNADLIK